MIVPSRTRRTRAPLVGQPRDVDGRHHVAELRGERGDRGVELGGLERILGLARPRVGDQVELVKQRGRTEAAALGSLLVQERVAQRSQEVPDVVLVAEKARPGEHLRERL